LAGALFQPRKVDLVLHSDVRTIAKKTWEEWRMPLSHAELNVLLELSCLPTEVKVYLCKCNTAGICPLPCAECDREAVK